MNIKSEELMVGNLVICHHPTQPEEVVAITFGLLSMLERQEDGFIDKDSPLYRIVKPIPLTDEILKRNKFEAKEGHLLMLDDFFDIDIWEYSDGIWIVKYDCCEMNMPFEQLTICYLHELQQFMRHCGIDKTIEYRLQTLVYGRERCIKKEK